MLVFSWFFLFPFSPVRKGIELSFFLISRFGQRYGFRRLLAFYNSINLQDSWHFTLIEFCLIVHSTLISILIYIYIYLKPEA